MGSPMIYDAPDLLSWVESNWAYAENRKAALLCIRLSQGKEKFNPEDIAKMTFDNTLQDYERYWKRQFAFAAIMGRVNHE